MRDHLSSSHRPEQAGALAILKSNNNLACILAACMLVLLAAPVALGWQRAAQPSSARNATETTTANLPVAEEAHSEDLADPHLPEAGASSQVEASTVVNNNQASTQLKVNGKEITVPQNGTVNQTVPNAAGGVTSVNVSSSSDSSGTSSSQSFTSIQTNSTNQSSTVINNSQ